MMPTALLRRKTTVHTFPIVKDDAAFARLIAFMMNRAGSSVVIVLKGKKMLQALDRTSYDTGPYAA